MGRHSAKSEIEPSVGLGTVDLERANRSAGQGTGVTRRQARNRPAKRSHKQLESAAARRRHTSISSFALAALVVAGGGVYFLASTPQADGDDVLVSSQIPENLSCPDGVPTIQSPGDGTINVTCLDGAAPQIGDVADVDRSSSAGQQGKKATGTSSRQQRSVRCRTGTVDYRINGSSVQVTCRGNASDGTSPAL